MKCARGYLGVPRARRLKEISAALGRRCEWFAFLHHIGDDQSGSGIAGLATRMRCFGRYLESIACLDRAGRLTLDRKLEAAFHHIGGFDSRMRVSRDRDPRLDYCFHEQRHIARRWTV